MFAQECFNKIVEAMPVRSCYVVVVTDGESSLSFSDLLQFATGADCVPPLGFEKLITVDFYERTMVNHYPSASTCDLRLWLPRGVDFETLKRLMEEAVMGGLGFGNI